MADATAQEYAGSAAGGPLPAPQVLVRTFLAPPGLPWDQARAAQLDAQHGAPLPITEVMHRLRRMEPWGPGRPARYAVFYIRRRDYSQPFEALVDVEGEAVRVAFGRVGAGSLARLRSVALVGGAGGAGLAIVIYGLVAGFSERAQASDRLDTLEHTVAVKLRAGQRLAGDQAKLTAFEQIRRTASGPAQVLDDLAWIARSKVTDARIVAIHWDHGLMVVEARGQTPPLAATGRELVRSPKSNAGISLWGVNRAAAPSTGTLR